MHKNLAVIPFPHTPNPENEERENSVSDLVTDSLTTSARACARTREEALEEIAEYFCDTFGAPVMPPVARRQCMAAMSQGLEPSLVFTAIDEAALAPRPSWAYAAAILRRLCAEGVLTQAAYFDRQERWQARRRG